MSNPTSEEPGVNTREITLTIHREGVTVERGPTADNDTEQNGEDEQNSSCSSCDSPNESEIEELVRNLNQEHGSFSWVTLGIRTGFHFACYPTQMTQILMQSGYEPFPPRRSVTLLGRPCLLLPSAVQYLKYIYEVDGIQGCFRGTFPRLMHQMLYTHIYHAGRRILGRRYIRSVVAKARLRDAEERQLGNQGALSRRQSQNDDSETSESSSPGFWDHFREVFHDLSAKLATIVVTYPIHVVVIRSIAKFVGREYLIRPNVLGEIKAIYSDFGILGFYRGIIPKMLGETCQTLIVGALAFFVSNQAPGIEVRSLLNLSFSVLVSAWTYQFNVVSTTMAVNGSCLMVGQPPIHPIRYDNWVHCWRDLSKRNILTRGSSIMCRYYTGPTRLVNGMKEPIDVTFGPNYLGGRLPEIFKR
ncbi:unnamed protein product [Orchesella dallaii]|uniref:Mitochondrial carrier 2 n=1 Tax=Orchesella dallaii TaxID=48710 RepID=A0ABP1PW83_9HEXA